MKYFLTLVKEDRELLKKKDLPPRVRNAIVLRRGEKKILVATLEKAKEMWVEVKKRWNFREMDIPGMKFLSIVCHFG